MQTFRHNRPLALGIAVLLLAVLTSGCARRGQAGPAAAAETATPSPVAAATVPAGTESPTASPSPVPAGVDPSPVPTPDLTAIEALIKDIDTDLGADASAAADEGSTP